MKNLKFVLILAVAVSLFSCKNDDDNTPAEPTLTFASFAGTYNLNFYRSNEVINEMVTGGTVTTTITEIGDTFGDSNFVFNANGTFVRDVQYRIVATTTLEGNAPMEETFIVTETDSGSYSLNNTAQTITIDGETYNVTLYNANELRIVFEEMTIDGDEESTFTEELRFSR